MTPIATLTDNTVTITAGTFSCSISAKEIERHWHGLSQLPDRRARLEVGALADRLADFFAYLDRLAAQGGAVPADAAERFARRHVELTRRYWHMEARCMSWFVVGPANFPTERNRKRMDSSDNARRIVADHVKAARESVRRAAWPYGEPGSAIRADNPDAPDLLREKIAKLQRRHSQMKAANAAIRSVKSGNPEERAQAIIDATGWPRALAVKCVQPNRFGTVGFEQFELSGALREIQRLELRLQSIESNRERGTVETEHNTSAGDVQIRENPDAARLQIIFPGKPDDKTRSVLKSNGFRWAPSEGAWQRHLNNAGRYAAQRVLAAIAEPVQ